MHSSSLLSRMLSTSSSSSSPARKRPAKPESGVSSGRPWQEKQKDMKYIYSDSNSTHGLIYAKTSKMSLRKHTNYMYILEISNGLPDDSALYSYPCCKVRLCRVHTTSFHHLHLHMLRLAGYDWACTTRSQNFWKPWKRVSRGCSSTANDLALQSADTSGVVSFCNELW
jgi:hypothetical protein